MEQAYLSRKTIINGKVIEDDIIKAHYDGNKAVIDVYDNGKHYYSQLNKDDITNLLMRHSNPISLEKRLMNSLNNKSMAKSKTKSKKMTKSKTKSMTMTKSNKKKTKKKSGRSKKY
jgi:hypothetical protein